MGTFSSSIGADDDLIAIYYPSLKVNPFYAIWIKSQTPLCVLYYILFFPFIDIVPSMVYYHSATVIEGIKYELRELSTDCNAAPSVPKSKLIYNLWSRFETLTVMVSRADALFGSMVIICQGILFSMICGLVYFLLNTMKTQPETLGIILQTLLPSFLLYSSRLWFTISFMSKLDRSSFELLSTLSYFSNQRANCSDEEERRMIGSFLGRMKQLKLAAYPSGFYKIKPSVFLNMLSLVVTYTIILLQTSDGSSKNMNSQNNTCACK